MQHLARLLAERQEQSRGCPAGAEGGDGGRTAGERGRFCALGVRSGHLTFSQKRAGLGVLQSAEPRLQALAREDLQSRGQGQFICWAKRALILFLQLFSSE